MKIIDTTNKHEVYVNAVSKESRWCCRGWMFFLVFGYVK